MTAVATHMENLPVTDVVDHGHTGPIRRLVQIMTHERRDIGLVIFFSVGVGILTLATPVTVQALVNFVSFGGLMQPLAVLGLLLFGLLVLAGAIRTLQTYVVELIQRRLFVRVATDLADRLPRVRAEAFDGRNGPELVNRFFDVVTVQKGAAMLLLDGIAVVLQTLVGLLVLAFYHPLLLAFDTVLVFAIGIVLFFLGRGAVRTAIKESKAKYAVAAALEEIASHPVGFKMAGAANYAKRRADDLAVDYVTARRAHFSVVLRQVVGAAGLHALAATALLTLGGWLVIQGQLTLGQLVAAELIVSTVLASFSKLGKQLESVYDLLAGVDKLGQLMDLPLERSNGSHECPKESNQIISLQNLSFSYSSQRPVLRDINLSVRQGERLCVVGGHGSGKSTLADLLFGLRQPSGGRYELFGVDIRELSLPALRDQIAIVKGIEVVQGTVAENVRMGREHLTPERVRAALKAVGLLDELLDLPEGLSTWVSSAGSPLSVGQARRLMLARAIAGEPRILVLDDVLDDLDIDTRREVLAGILPAGCPWTLVASSRHPAILNGLGRVVFLNFDGTLTEHLPPGSAREEI